VSPIEEQLMSETSSTELLQEIDRQAQTSHRWKTGCFAALGAAVLMFGVNVYAFSQRQADAAPNAPEAPPAAAKARVEEAAGMPTYFANFYRVTGSPEELFLDLGVNPEAGQAQTQPIKLSARVVVTFYTAKRLLGALQFAVNRHERFFGPIELDARKRVLPGAEGPEDKK
jgi:hypothetical protein